MNQCYLEISSQEELDAAINIFGMKRVIDGFMTYDSIFNKHIEEVVVSIVERIQEYGPTYMNHFSAINNSKCEFSSEHLLSFIKCSNYSPKIIQHVTEHLFRRSIKASGEIFDLIQDLDPKYLFDFINPETVEFHLNYYFVYLNKSYADNFIKISPYIMEDVYRRKFHNYIINSAEAFAIKDDQVFPRKMFFLTKELFDGFMEFISEGIVTEKKFFDELFNLFDCFKTHVDSNGNRWYLNYAKENNHSIQIEFHCNKSQSYYKTIYCFDPFVEDKTPKEIFDAIFNEFVESLEN